MWKRSFVSKNIKFGSVALGIPSCFNASLSWLLMLVYHFMLCKFILYLKSKFWENKRSKPVLITKCYVVLLISQSRDKVELTVMRQKRQFRVCEISLKKVRNVPFQLFLNPKCSSSPTNHGGHGGRHFWRPWATFQKFFSDAPENLQGL